MSMIISAGINSRAGNSRSFHSAPRPPNIQNVASRTWASWGAVYTIKLVTALNMAETATPTSTKRIGVICPPLRARAQTARMDNSAPQNAPAGMLKRLPQGRTTPQTMANTAPVEAPLEMPST